MSSAPRMVPSGIEIGAMATRFIRFCSVQMSLVALPDSAVPTAGNFDRRSSPNIALTFRSRASTLPDESRIATMSAFGLPPVRRLALIFSHCSNAAWRRPVSSDLSNTPTTACRCEKSATWFSKSVASRRATSP